MRTVLFSPDSKVNTSSALGLLMVTNGCKWLQMVTNGYKWLQMVTNCYKWLQIVTNCYKLLQFIKSGMYLYRTCRKLQFPLTQNGYFASTVAIKFGSSDRCSLLRYQFDTWTIDCILSVIQ
jgi:hypothetical protein